ncbi:biofilm development regulator YmgB/AriR family protein [Serratia ureilytica]
MSASAHSNEQYEILLRNVSLALGDAVLQLIKNHKKVSGGNILSQLVTEIEREQDQQRFAALRSAIELVGLAPKRLSARYKRRQGLRPA